ncbi:hypothetical protein [Micromonospora marina]|uniref:hypothetical protein n=1 Tax=Micromonospora marina TaxID=307120 RepID=UPI003455B98F
MAKTNAAFWAEKVTTNRRRDADTDARLTAEGWTVLRIWEHEEPAEAADRVAETVKRLSGGSTSRT